MGKFSHFFFLPFYKRGLNCNPNKFKNPLATRASPSGNNQIVGAAGVFFSFSRALSVVGAAGVTVALTVGVGKGVTVGVGLGVAVASCVGGAGVIGLRPVLLAGTIGTRTNCGVKIARVVTTVAVAGLVCAGRIVGWGVGLGFSTSGSTVLVGEANTVGELVGVAVLAGVGEGVAVARGVGVLVGVGVTVGRAVLVVDGETVGVGVGVTVLTVRVRL